MRKILGQAFAFLMAAILFMPEVPVLAHQSEYIWVLVNVIDYNSADNWEVANESPVYQNEYSCSRGFLSVKTTYIGKSEDWRTPPILQGEGVKLSASFSEPPARLNSNEEVNISVILSASENNLSYFSFDGYASASFDRPDVMPGFMSRNAIRFADKDGNINIKIGTENGYATVSEFLIAKPPVGREEGEQIALRQQFYRGIPMSTYYIYEWQRVDNQSFSSQEDKQSSEPVGVPEDSERIEQTDVSQSNKDTLSRSTSRGKFPDHPKPAGGPSGTHINDLYGEVLIWIWVERGNEFHWSEGDELFVEPGKNGYWDAWTPGLGEVPVNAIIETRSNSGVILSLRDNTMFVMKSNSMIINAQPEEESRLTILAGHVWGNVQQMLKDGSMDIEMSQGVAGIKGTTFVLEDDGKSSTIKVFEGKVDFKPHDGRESVLVKGGSKLRVTEAELSLTKTFDSDAELSVWSVSVQEMTYEAMKGIKRGYFLPVIIVLLMILLVLGGGITWVTLTNNSRKSSTTYKFCRKCGKPVLRHSQFCPACGNRF